MVSNCRPREMVITSLEEQDPAYVLALTRGRHKGAAPTFSKVSYIHW